MSNDAYRSRVLDAISQVVVDLALPGIEAVVVRHRDKQTGTEKFPCVEIRRDTSPDVENNLTAEHDEVGYGVRVAFRFRDSGGPNSPAPRSDSWHEQLAHAFRNRQSMSPKLPNMPEVRAVTIEPLTIGSIATDAANMIEGGMVVRVFIVEPRGPLS